MKFDGQLMGMIAVLLQFGTDIVVSTAFSPIEQLLVPTNGRFDPSRLEDGGGDVFETQVLRSSNRGLAFDVVQVKSTPILSLDLAYSVYQIRLGIKTWF